MLSGHSIQDYPKGNIPTLLTTFILSDVWVAYTQFICPFILSLTHFIGLHFNKKPTEIEDLSSISDPVG